jgi:hypothetical protein
MITDQMATTIDFLHSVKNDHIMVAVVNLLTEMVNEYRKENDTVDPARLLWVQGKIAVCEELKRDIIEGRWVPE